MESNVRFKLRPHALPDELDESNLDVTFECFKNIQQLERYLDLFKLKGRYANHKSKALDLIRKKQRYNETRIAELAKQVNLSIAVVKQDIFGREIFDDSLKNRGLSKYKKDIAKALKLI